MEAFDHPVVPFAPCPEEEPVGISVYGYGDWTSFYYPGGLDLKPIPVE